MTVEEMAEGIGRAHGAALDDVARALWAAHAAGQVTDDEAESLSVVIEARRGPSHAARARIGGILRFSEDGHSVPPLLEGEREGGQSGDTPKGTHKVSSPSLRRPPCPKRAEARERSRQWAAAGRMPPAIAAKFTPGEQAALAVIAFEFSKRQVCDKSIGELATVAGVSQSTVKRAMRQARFLGLLTIQERRLSRYRNETNIVRIISKPWISWLDLRGKGGGGQRRTGTNTSGLREERRGSSVGMNRPTLSAERRSKCQTLRRLP